MGPIRRTINLIVALTLAAAGLGGLGYLLFFAVRFRGWAVMATVTIGVVGLYWLWADYINADPRAEK
jgi:hypothetical protein